MMRLNHIKPAKIIFGNNAPGKIAVTYSKLVRYPLHFFGFWPRELTRHLIRQYKSAIVSRAKKPLASQKQSLHSCALLVEAGAADAYPLPPGMAYGQRLIASEKHFLTG